MPESATSSSRPRVLSGMRPTGKLHLGNYMGALANWVKLQDQYECYFFIADLHALTTDYADTSNIAPNTLEVALDFLGAGLDPNRCTIFVQSQVKQHYELPLLLGMITPLGWLERVPSYKEMQENLAGKDLTTFGFLGYPVLMASDILLYQANYVPVGQDQKAHVELTREIARRFNFIYEDPNRPARPISSKDEFGAFLDLNKELADEPLVKHDGTLEKDALGEGATRPTAVLIEPQVLLTPSPKLPGTDGRKMSKSYGNTIALTDSAKLVSEKLAKMWNGGQRSLVSDPGDPEKCPVYDLHKLFSPPNILQQTGDGCKSAAISCVECKHLAARSTSLHLQPIQSRRTEYELQPNEVQRILRNGAEKAAERAEQTMASVRSAIGISRVAQFPTLNVFERYSYDTSQPIRHSLENHRGIWNETNEKVETFLVDYWKSRMVPSDCVLKPANDCQFVTSRNKRVLASAARQEPNGWHFRIPAKNFEVWALLCWDQSYTLNDFIIPQMFYAQPFAQMRKASKEKTIHLRIWKIGEKWNLTFEGLHHREEIGRAIVVQAVDPIDITGLLGKYYPLR